MDSYAYACNLCGSVCPVGCLPTHRDTFLCHNATCDAYNPSSPNSFHQVTDESLSTDLEALLLTRTNASHATRPCDALSTSLPVPPKETHEQENKERDDRNAAEILRAIQELKIQDIISSMRAVPEPSTPAHPHDLRYVPSITKVYPGVYLGNMACVESEEVLRTYRIKAVISVVSPSRMPFPGSQRDSSSEDLHPLEKLFNIKDRMVIPAKDSSSEDLIQYFEDTCRFIWGHRHPVTAAALAAAAAAVAGSDTDAQSRQERVDIPSSTDQAEGRLKKRRVLVHCTLGASRSATIVAAYLMWRKREPATSVLTDMKRKRPSVNPNKGFLDQLLVFEDIHYNIWGNGLACVSCLEYKQLQERLRDYESLRKRQREGERGSELA